MKSPSSLAASVAIGLLLASPSEAQHAVPLETAGAVPRVEVGAHVVVGGGVPGGFGLEGGPRLTVNTSPRDAGELLVSLDRNRGFSGTYTLQYKRVVRARAAERLAVFATVGVTGSFRYARIPAEEVTRPDQTVVVFPGYTDAVFRLPQVLAAGVGVQRGFTRHIAFRAELQGGVSRTGAGMAALAGVSIPMGQGYPP